MPLGLLGQCQRFIRCCHRQVVAALPVQVLHLDAQRFPCPTGSKGGGKLPVQVGLGAHGGFQNRGGKGWHPTCNRLPFDAQAALQNSSLDGGKTSRVSGRLLKRASITGRDPVVLSMQTVDETL